MSLLQKKIALSMFPKLGPRRIRKLVAYAGGVEEFFGNDTSWLNKIPGYRKSSKLPFDREEALRKADVELEKVQKDNTSVRFYLDENYPLRLRECEDAPIVIYSKGNADLNPVYTLSVVGTRRGTAYGKKCTEDIISYLAGRYPDLLIISGLAYGIDIYAHRAAIQCGLPTVAALAHGFDYLYPVAHKKEASQIVTRGELVTEFPSSKPADPGNFVSRNRIIAGLADATLIVESAEKGGALITADLANSYNREVFAIPGKINDKYSRGCHGLIKENKAALVETGADIESAMGWEVRNVNQKSQALQKQLFPKLSHHEKEILDCLNENEPVLLDEICYALNLPINTVSAGLLHLEFSGLIQSLPGKQYQKI